MINVSSTVFVAPKKEFIANTSEGNAIIVFPGSANLDVLIVENLSLDSAEEYELPNNYMTCAVAYGAFEYDGNVVNANTIMRYSSDVTKININANSKIIILSRQT